MVRGLAFMISTAPILITSGGTLLCAQTLSDIMARMDKSAPQFKAMTADIKRNVHTAIVDDDSGDKNPDAD
jgi:hypothetical protein